MTRLMWDVIDDNNDAGGNDTWNLSISELVAELEAMTCTGNCDGPGGAVDDCNVDTTCNEHNPPSGGSCTPGAGGVLNPPSPMSSTRDAYNAFDLMWEIPGSQSDLRVLNCVQTAD